MQSPEWDDTRLSVIRRLQFITATFPVGSEASEIADHAIELALSTKRNDRSAPLLFRNVWRNARYIVRRRRKFVLDPLTERSAVGRQIVRGELARCGAPRTPEELVVATDLAERIRGAAARIDRLGTECFDGMIAGDSLEETAHSLNINTRRVKRIRAYIRWFARALLRRAAA